jgi:general secretion pathway protein C
MESVKQFPKLTDQTIIYKGVRQSIYMDPNTNKMAGIKIHEIQSNHIFYSLGARMGDVLKQVNGIALDDTKKMLELWANIKNANKVTVDIDRKGSCFTYDFTVRN